MNKPSDGRSVIHSFLHIYIHTHTQFTSCTHYTGLFRNAPLITSTPLANELRFEMILLGEGAKADNGATFRISLKGKGN